MASKNGSGGRANRPTFTDQEALLFHSQGRPGKLEVVATKPMATQRDLSLAYSPGVAVPVLAIAVESSAKTDAVATRPAWSMTRRLVAISASRNESWNSTLWLPSTWSTLIGLTLCAPS